MGRLYPTTVQNLLAQADIWEELNDGGFYLGFCELGTSATSEAKWRICKVTPAVNNVQKRQWADGDAHNKNKIWDNRTQYTYTWAI